MSEKTLEKVKAAIKSGESNGDDVRVWLVERIEELEARNQWQPISTAPKDGTWVDLFDGIRRTNCFYEGDKWKRVDRFHKGIRHTTSFNPTHWMPLPEPPKD